MSNYSPNNPPSLKAHDNKVSWNRLPGASLSLAISQFARQNSMPAIVLCEDVNTANRLFLELSYFAGGQFPVLQFPDRETLPYDHFSPHEDLVSQRLTTLSRAADLKQGIIVTSIATIMHQLLPPEYLLSHSFLLSISDHLDLITFRNRLTLGGYQHVEQVIKHGEFALRGSIIDIFPMGHNHPYRIELFDNEVESIRSFDPDDQRSIEKVSRIQLLPAREYPLTDESIALFRQRWRDKFSGNPMESALYATISQGEPAAGIEYYLPFFFEKTANFFDYLPENSVIFRAGDIHHSAGQFWEEIQHRYDQLRYDRLRPLCEPELLFNNIDVTFSRIKKHCQIKLNATADNDKGIQFTTEPGQELLVNSKLKRPLGKLEDYINQSQQRLLFCTESTGRRETLIDLLSSIGVKPVTINHWSEFLASDNRFNITTAPIDSGFTLVEPNISIIAESQLFGAQVKQRQVRAQRQQDPNLMIRNLTELNIGAPVVHIDHGVGRYIGLQIIDMGGVNGEYLTLEYAGGDKIYVPVASLHLISRYTGADSDHAPIQRLGSSQWQKIKDKTAKRVRDVAAELLNIYSKRQAHPATAIKKSNLEFQTFRNAFPFEETPDQTLAIDAVIADMCSEKCMDRLVCGDVGFGKTEVAMQAAFLAAHAGKQVAVLVPTTLLATQHTQNFKDRFSDWPIKIAGLSRMCTPAETTRICHELEKGRIDIVIGTHKLLGDAIKFKDLGLLIVDEEQRFGVRQKERIKALRAHVDILTLTATPIPRTLNMAMSGIRDLSVITTPPARRLAIKTFVHESRANIIREAIMRETMRGGQVYFLHNEVSTIKAQAAKLQDIVPEARIAIAHGQLRERELERIMTEFYHQRYNVLLCSTIIESGIDIPSANTIIINRADRFGLSQLHQLRGRVGRSHHQAYAYMLTPDKKAMTRDAKKRLEAIASLEDLGSGFQLATHDLEIRGAGEILGEEQSGQIEAIGFSMYMDMLEQAVKALKSGKEPNFDIISDAGPDIDLRISALLPEQYIGDVNLRLTLYKRLTSCNNDHQIDDLMAEMIDRFGLLPPQAKHLFQLTRLKLLATKLGIKKIDIGTQYGHIEFTAKPNVNPAVIIKLIQLYPKIYQLQGANKLRYAVKAKEPDDKIALVNELLNKFQ